MQGRKPRRIYADFILTLNADEPESTTAPTRCSSSRPKKLIHLVLGDEVDRPLAIQSVFRRCRSPFRHADQ